MVSMRRPRITAGEGEDGLYHAMSRIVGGDFIFGFKEKEFFVRHMWRLADFLSIGVLDYSVMSNHYHQLLAVPGLVELSDEELLQRVQAYYGQSSREAMALEKAFTIGGAAASIQRQKHLKRMGNLSEYQKHLKQGFTTWYNRQRGRQGTLWMERFESVYLEDSQHIRQVIASYIDLNCVRAGMVDDPKNYRHCGYAAALAGDQRCRQGIMRIMGCEDWESAAAQYRILLMTRGSSEGQGKKGSVPRKLYLRTLSQKGKLPLPELLRLRVRYFTHGLVLGSADFVEQVFQQNRSHFGERRKSGPRPLRGIEAGDLCTIRDLRNSIYS